MLSDAARQLRAERTIAFGADTVRIEGTEAIATSAEGVTARMPLSDLLATAMPASPSTGGVILPDGIKAVESQGPWTIWVWECPPHVHRLNWMSREVRLALPYLLLLVMFHRSRWGSVSIQGYNECFFRNAPLKSLEDAVCYPALLNCQKFAKPEGKPLSWFCARDPLGIATTTSQDPNERMRKGFAAMRHSLLETKFDHGSERGEDCSWFTEYSRLGIDWRIQTVESWQHASAQNPLFVLEVPWLSTNHTLRQVIARTFNNSKSRINAPWTARALARIVFNHQGPPTPGSAPA